MEIQESIDTYTGKIAVNKNCLLRVTWMLNLEASKAAIINIFKELTKTIRTITHRQ